MAPMEGLDRRFTRRRAEDPDDLGVSLREESWVKRVGPGDWIKIAIFLFGLIVAGTEIRSRLAHAETESAETRSVVREVQKDIEQLKLGQTRTNTLLEEFIKRQDNEAEIDRAERRGRR